MDRNSGNIEVEEYKRITDVPLRKIVINNLDRRISPTDLKSLFSTFGCVEEFTVDITIQDSLCAYVTFEKEEDAIRALREKNIIYNIHLRVSAASSYEQPNSLQQLLLTSDKLSRIQNSNNSYNNDDRNDVNNTSLNALNNDCLRHIFSFLPIVDKVRAEIVCKRWKDLIQQNWSTMRTLNFIPFTWGMSYKDTYRITPRSFREILSKCGKYLQEMNIGAATSDKKTLTYEALKKLINLRDLRIICCYNVNNLTVSVINNHCTNLRILKLKYMEDITVLEFMNTKLTNLEALNIKCNSNMTNDILLHIVQHCSKLTKINVKDCPDVTAEGIRDIQQNYSISIKF